MLIVFAILFFDFDTVSIRFSVVCGLLYSFKIKCQEESADFATSAKTSEVYTSYWQFAFERQAVFFRRLRKETYPWTKDPVIAKYKFTNAYRASDRVSQYLIRNVIYREDLPKSPREIFFRILLFKLFNKIETWELLEQKFHTITYEDYKFNNYANVLDDAKQIGTRIYSAAYVMPPDPDRTKNFSKHRSHLLLLEKMIKDELPDRLTEIRTMREGFNLLTSYSTIGKFLGYQFITDINYSEITNFSEMEFVVPGPGARSGIHKCFLDFGDFDEVALIKMMSDIQEREFERFELEFESLWGRRLQLIDCQNLFCEVDKYSRVRHPESVGLTNRKRIKQKFRPTLAPINVFFPPKWNLNDKVRREIFDTSISAHTRFTE